MDVHTYIINNSLINYVHINIYTASRQVEYDFNFVIICR